MKKPAAAQFLRNHPDRERNVFLMMGFTPTPMRDQVEHLTRGAGERLGFDVIRADDEDYSGEVWANVKLCLDHCSYGIAVFDSSGSSAENLSVELGYLFARGTPCLILREVTLASPPTMLAHRLHTSYSAFDLPGTLEPQVERWLTARAGGTNKRLIGHY